MLSLLLLLFHLNPGDCYVAVVDPLKCSGVRWLHLKTFMYCGAVFSVGLKSNHDDKLVSFSALTLLVWSFGL